MVSGWVVSAGAAPAPCSAVQVRALGVCCCGRQRQRRARRDSQVASAQSTAMSSRPLRIPNAPYVRVAALLQLDVYKWPRVARVSISSSSLLGCLAFEKTCGCVGNCRTLSSRAPPGCTEALGGRDIRRGGGRASSVARFIMLLSRMRSLRNYSQVPSMDVQPGPQLNRVGAVATQAGSTRLGCAREGPQPVPAATLWRAAVHPPHAHNACTLDRAAHVSTLLWPWPPPGCKVGGTC